MEDESDEPNDEDGFRMASRLALEKYGALDGLNASQRLAVEGAVTNRLTLVQGPPGTGTFSPFLIHLFRFLFATTNTIL